jgi:ubiquinone/menaquinone biosynthesis C-methylase UbiE
LQNSLQRGLDVSMASIIHLPFKDDSFDTVYSVKVLAHVPDLREALSELGRVVKPGGFVIPEFYNKWSLRHIIKISRPGLKISPVTTDKEVFTRYYSLSEIRALVPTNLKLVHIGGVRIASLIPQFFNVPILGDAMERIERIFSTSPLRRFGGFAIPIFQKQ